MQTNKKNKHCTRPLQLIALPRKQASGKQTVRQDSHDQERTFVNNCVSIQDPFGQLQQHIDLLDRHNQERTFANKDTCGRLQPRIALFDSHNHKRTM